MEDHDSESGEGRWLHNFLHKINLLWPLPRLVAWGFRLSSSLTAQSAWYLETRI